MVYLSGVAFTASSFTWMKGLVNEYRMKTEWPYIFIILLNGMVPTFLSASEHPIIHTINPVVIVLLTPLFAILEFAILSRDSIRTYIFFIGMIMLQFACFFGIGATIITAFPVEGLALSDTLIRSASLTFTMFLLSLSLGLYALLTRRYTTTMKMIMHDWSAGYAIFFYMILNGFTLGIATAFDYEIYFTDINQNPLRSASITGMIIRYSLILLTSFILMYVQCRVEINRQKVNEYEIAANTDPLTGLFNRMGMDHFVSQFIVEAKEKEDAQSALFLMDLDHFKAVNDNLGHPVGDDLLIKASKEIKSVFRDADIVCRLGGDEFCVFMRGDCSIDVVERKAQMLNDRVRFSLETADGKDINTTVSIGVALFPKNGEDYETLYKSADEALYNTKEKGRNGYTFA